MPITYHIGNLLESGCKYICHQVNCQGKMNSGIAKSIREKWPEVFASYYAKWTSNHQYNYPTSFLLGDIQIVALFDDYNQIIEDEMDTCYVINMFAQDNYGYDNRRYTSYDAFWVCLNQIKNSISKGATIGFPYKIGCVRGGADWRVIIHMIELVLGEDYNIEIWSLEAD